MDWSQHEAGRKRRRKIWACSECRRRKLQCDRGNPACGRCQKAGQADACQYIDALGGTEHGGMPSLPSASRTPAEPTTPARCSSEPNNGFDGADISSSLAHLERRLRLLELKTASEPASQQVPVSTEPQSAFEFDRNDLDALCPPKGDYDCAVLRGNTFRTKFHGGTFPGTLAQIIPGLKLFTKDAFATSPVLEEIRQGISQSQSSDHLAGFNHVQPSQAALIDLLSTKEETDRQVALYMDSFDHVYHVLHRPAFEQDYARVWLDPNTIDPRHIIIVLLVVAIAHYSTIQSGFPDIVVTCPVRDKATTIIEMCEGWLRARVQKYDNILDFQIAFLLLLGRQLGAKWYKRTWVNAGNSLRVWMCAGLHRRVDALHSETTVLMKQMRKRLWTAVAEFELQAAFEHGMCGLSWPQQSDIGPPSNVSDEILEQEIESESVQEYTRTSFLSIAGESLHFRHHLNTTLNCAAHAMTFSQTKDYADKLYKFLQEVPRDTGPRSAVVYALLSIHLLQYLLALHGRQLQQSTSLMEKKFSRVALVEVAVKMIDCHKTAISNGSQVVEALYGDHLRIALSVCSAYVTADPQSDCIITTAIEEHSFRVMNEVFVMAGAKVKHFGGDRRHFWLIAAAMGLMRSKRDPERRAVYLQESVDQFARPYSDLILKQRLRSTTPLNGGMAMFEQMQEDDTALAAQRQPDPSIDELFYQWCNNMPDWACEDWSFGANGVLQ